MKAFAYNHYAKSTLTWNFFGIYSTGKRKQLGKPFKGKLSEANAELERRTKGLRFRDVKMECVVPN